jgi:hypothetical protein
LDKTLTVSMRVNIGLIKSLCETERRHICICVSFLCINSRVAWSIQ